MTETDQTTDPRELAVEEAFCEYLRRLDAGEELDRDAFLSQHPEIADLLAAHLSTDSVVRQMAGPTEAEATTENSLQATMVSSPGQPGATTDTATVARSVDTHPEAGRETWGIGAQFGRYQVQKLLGQGAMGAVYLARDTQLDRLVALKIPKFDQQAGPELLERFYREARAAATLRHPNICPVYDVGELDGQTFLSMAFIAGQPLSHFSKARKQQGERSVAKLVMKLALALQEAHNHGVIHRDLKPANIMVAENGEPVVMDFGLARRMDSTDTRVTRSGTIVGTPAYMSPEQVEGDPDAVGPASDQYSLGVILYELLTGRLPFQGTVLSVIGQIAHKRPADILELRPDIDPRLATICKKMMAKKSEARFKDLNAAAAALNRYLQESKTGVGVAAQPSTWQPDPEPSPTVDLPGPQLPRKAKPKSRKKSKPSHWKHWPLIGGLAALVSVLLAGVIYFTTGDGTVRIDIQDPEIQVVFQGETFTIDDSGTPIEVSPGQHKLKVKRNGLELETEQFTVSRNGKVAIEVTWQEGELLAKNGEQVIGRERPAAPQAEASGVQFQLVRRFEGHEQPVKSVDVSPDGKWAASGSGYPEGDKTVRIWEMATGKVRHVLKGHENNVLCVAFSPDGKRLLSQGFRWRTLLWDVESGKLIKQVSGIRNSGEQVEFLTNETFVTLGEGERPVEVWDLNSGKILKIISLSGIHTKFALNREKQLLAAASPTGEVTCLDLSTGKTLRRIPAPELPPSTRRAVALAITSNGAEVVVGHVGKLFHWSIETGELLHELPTQAPAIEGIQITSDNRYAITAGASSGLLEVFDLKTGNRIAVTRDPIHLWSIALVPDETAILVGGGNSPQHSTNRDCALRLWKLPASVRPAAPPTLARDFELAFDGRDDFVEMPTLIYRGTHPLTIEAWLTPLTPPAPAPDSELNHPSPFHVHWQLGVVLPDSQRIIQGVHARPDWKQFGDARLTPGQRVHVALVRDVEKMSLYLGGHLVGELQKPMEQDLERPRPFRLGRGQTNFPQSFLGRLDEIRVSKIVRYTKDFTPEERFEPDEHTMALYHCDEGSGEVLKDASGNGHDGKLSGPDWVFLGNTVPVDDDTGRIGFSLVRRFERHTAPVHAVACAPDGQTAFSSGMDGAVIRWDVASGKVLDVWTDHDSQVFSITVSPDGGRIASGGTGSVVVRNLESGETQKLSGHEDLVSDLVFADRFLVTASHDGTARQWNLETGEEIRKLEFGVFVNELSATSDGQFVLVAGRLKQSSLWNLQTGEVRRLDPAPEVWANAMLPDDKRVITGHLDGRLRLWDLKTGRMLREMGGHTGAVAALVVTLDGQYVISGGFDKRLKVFDLSTGQQVAEHTVDTHCVTNLALAPDGQHLLTGGGMYFDNGVKRDGDYSLQLWRLPQRFWPQTAQPEAAKPEELLTLSAKYTDHGVGKDGKKAVAAVAISADDSLLASGGRDGWVIIRELASGKILQRINTEHPVAWRSLSFSPDGNQLLSAADGTLNIWDVKTGERTWTVSSAGENIGARFLPDGLQVCTDAASYTESAEIWDIKTKAKVKTLAPGLQASVNHKIAVSPDGRYLACNHYDRLLIFDLTASRLLHELDVHAPRGVDFTSDSNSIVVTEETVAGEDQWCVSMWTVETGKRLWTSDEKLPGQGKDCSITPDGRFIVAGGNPGPAPSTILLNAEDGSLVARFPTGNASALQQTVISPDSRFAVLAKSDGSVEVWRLPENVRPKAAAVTDKNSEITLIRKFEEEYAGELRAVAITPDGRHILSGSSPQNPRALRLHEVSTGRLVHQFDQPKDVFSLAISPDGKYAVAGDRTSIYIFDLPGRKLLHSGPAHNSAIFRVAISPGSQYALSSGTGDKKAIVWDLKTGTQLAQIETGYGCWGLAFVTEEQVVLGGWAPPGVCELWDWKSNKKIQTYSVGRMIKNLAVSPDSNSMLVAGHEGLLRLVDLKTNQFWDFQGHETDGLEGIVLSAQFLPDGNHCVSTANDGTLRVWSLQSRKQIASLASEKHALTQVVITPDGREIITGGGYSIQQGASIQQTGDYALRLWKLPESVWPKADEGQK